MKNRVKNIISFFGALFLIVNSTHGTLAEKPQKTDPRKTVTYTKAGGLFAASALAIIPLIQRIEANLGSFKIIDKKRLFFNPFFSNLLGKLTNETFSGITCVLSRFFTIGIAIKWAMDYIKKQPAQGASEEDLEYQKFSDRTKAFFLLASAAFGALLFILLIERELAHFKIITKEQRKIIPFLKGITGKKLLGDLLEASGIAARIFTIAIGICAGIKILHEKDPEQESAESA